MTCKVETQAPSLFQRINEVRKLVKYIQKDSQISAGAGGNYKAVTHDMVTAKLREALIANGILVVPDLVISHVNPPPEGGKMIRFEAVFDISFINVDDSEDRLKIRVPAHANDNGDKAPGKAMSYAMKYALLKVFTLETGESDESRVGGGGLDEEDIMFHCDQLKDAKSIPQLADAYAAAVKDATSAKDRSAAKVFIRIKDEMKALLQEESDV